MKKESYQFHYDLYEDASELSEGDRMLVEEARKVTAKAYAPYSHFLVGAVARMKDGRLVAGTNQENAAYPVGICAERVLLSNAAMQFTGLPIETMAITYHNTRGESNSPVSPCGMCRQSLAEYEERQGAPIRLILTGMEGQVMVLSGSSSLLPFSFGGSILK